MRFLTPICIALVLMVPVGVSAAESRKELGLRLDALTNRLQVLEDRMLTGDPAALRLQQRVDELDRQLRNQIGENERMQFENARQRDDIEALRRELDLLNEDVRQARDDASAARSALGSYITGEQAKDEGGVLLDDNPAAEMALADGGSNAEARFAEARIILENGFFEQAYMALDGFVVDFSKHALAGQALYWLGEIQMVRGDPSAAAEKYLASLKGFRTGKRAPDSMVKLAAAFSALGDTDEACRTLKLFPKEYPKASAAVQTKAEIESRRAGCNP